MTNPIGRKIKLLMADGQNGIYTGNELADRAGVCIQTISNIIVGRTNPTQTTIELISKAFDVPPDYFSAGENRNMINQLETIATSVCKNYCKYTAAGKINKRVCVACPVNRLK